MAPKGRSRPYLAPVGVPADLGPATPGRAGHQERLGPDPARTIRRDRGCRDDPVTLAELRGDSNPLILACDWIIWLIFVAEYLVMLRLPPLAG